MTDPQFVVHDTKAALSAAVSARLVAEIVDAVQLRGVAHVVLTGGSMGGSSLAGLRDAGTELDWSRVHLWWGDERFVPLGSDERNDTQTHGALLDHIGIPEQNVHMMAPSDGANGDDVDAAALAYQDDLAGYATAGAGGVIGVPAFDVLMLGVGPDAHVASLFPHHPGVRTVDANVLAVFNSPKPPPVRLSLTFTAINCARQVWFLVAGAEKADAVAHASSPGADPWDFPAAGATGTDATIWWLDRDAASKTPAG